MRSALLLAPALALCSCVSLRWDRGRIDAPITSEQLTLLRPAEDDLASCLRKLGAPNLVQRGPGDTMDLLWSWSDSTSVSLSVSYEITDFVSPSVSYSEGDRELPGLRLRFDARWRLLGLRLGEVTDLVRDPERERAGERHRRDPPMGPWDRPF